MSGIIRRIDELGRIVIPKEIRKSMKIKTNDELDIEVKDGSLILRKYCDFYDINTFLNKLVHYLGSSIDKDILIFDKNKVISQYKCIFDNYINKELDDKLVELLNIRSEYKEIDGNIEINKKVYTGKFILSNIIPNGDVKGGIIIYSEDTNFNDKDNFILKMLNKTLTKYIEE